MRYYGVISVMLAFLLSACSGSDTASASKSVESDSSNYNTESEREVSVGISPSSISLYAGAAHVFTAAVHGDDDRSVAWSTTGGSIAADGSYVAPQEAGTYEVTATSNADASKSARAIVTVETAPVDPVISLSPQSATVVTGESISFSATLSGLDSSQVQWHVEEGDAGGVISGDGYYEAPEIPGIYHVVAESVEDTALRAVAAVTVIPDFAVTLGVSTRDLLFGEPLELTGEVSEGPFEELRYYVEESDGGVIHGTLYTAPHATGVYHLVAESVVDPNRRARVAIYVCGAFDRIFTYADIGTDSVVGTDDDLVLWNLRFSYGPPHLITDTRYAAFEPAGDSHGWLELAADGVEAAMLYEGAQDIRGAADEAISRYYSLFYHKGGQGHGYAAHGTAGADGVYGTPDDDWNMWAENIYDNGSLVRVDYFDHPGDDGVWGTEDDRLAGYDVFDYAAGHLVAIREKDAGGALKQKQVIENDADGLPLTRTIIDHRDWVRASFEYEHDDTGRITSRIERAYKGNGAHHPQGDTRLAYVYADSGDHPVRITQWTVGNDKLIGTDDDEPVLYMESQNMCPW